MTKSRRKNNTQKATRGAAIIGLAGRFPGAADEDALWDLLQSDRPVTGPVPQDRAELLPWANRWQIEAGFLSDIDRFDASFFQIAPKDAKLMDPQQRILLEVVWQAIENAGLTPNQLPRETGVFVGVISSDYGTFAEELAMDGAVPLRGTDHYQVANRISYHFDLTGPSIAVDTACSGSGVAIHQAMRALETGDCKMAIVAGVNLFLHASRFAQFRQLGIISPDNCCRPFRAGANGTVYGEGVAAMLLRPADRADSECDNVRAYLRGSAVTSGGRTQGFTVPSGKAQRRTLELALAQAGEQGHGIGYVEAHGTGTKLGDPIEVRGLTEAFAAKPGTAAESKTTLGSIKGHIGHLESAAAMAGIAKIVLQMERGRLGPSLPVADTNPMINFGKTPFILSDGLSDWPDSDTAAPRRAILSSFGAGGVNACLVLEAASETEDTAQAPCPGLFPFSARDAEALQRMAQVWNEWLGGAGSAVSPARLATTLQTGRVVFDHRLVVLAEDVVALRAGLAEFISGQRQGMRAFSGQRLTGLADAFSAESAGVKTVEAMLQQTEHDGVLQQLAALWANGVDIEWAQGIPRRSLPRTIPAPGYPFRGDHYWLPTAAQSSVASTALVSVDERAARFPGQRIDLAGSGSVFVFRLDETTMPSITDHRIFNEVVVPGAFFVALAATAAQQVLCGSGFDLVDGLFREGLVLIPGTSREIQCLVSAPQDTQGGHRTIEISSRTFDSDEAWTHHFHTDLQPNCQTPIARIAEIGEDVIVKTSDNFYARGRALGFGWEGPYRALSGIRCSAEAAEAHIAAIGAVGNETSGAVAHPATLDAIFQVALTAVHPKATRDGEAFMPLGLQRFRVHGLVDGPVRAQFTLKTAPGAQSERFDGRITGADGHPLFEVEGLTVLRVAEASLHALRKRSATGVSATLGQAADAALLSPVWVTEQPDTALEEQLTLLPKGDLSSLKPLLALEGVVTVQADQAKMPERLNLVFAPPPMDVTGENLARAAADLADTLRLLSSEHPGTEVRFWLVGHDGIDQIAFTGFCHSLRWEMPGMRPVSVILAGRRSETEQARALAALMRADPEEDCWRLGDEGWQVARFLPASVIGTLPDIAGRRCLVTGGTGGLGLLHLDWLLQRGAAEVVVIGRSPAPGRDGLPDCLSPLATRHGADRLIYRSADLADGAALTTALDGLPAPETSLGLVLHCAGNSGEGSLLTLDEVALLAALEVKLDGLKLLVDAVRPKTPARIIALSSATAHLGAPGQTAYAMANAGLEALCYRFRQEGLPVSSVAWGPWAGVGMTARAAATGAAKATTGIEIGFKPDGAAELFERVYALEPGQYVALPNGWRKSARHLGIGPLPSLWRDPVQDRCEILESYAVSAPKPKPLLDARAAVEAAMREVLDYPDASAFDWMASFRSLGVDSLSAIRLRDAVVTTTGLSLSATVIFDYPSPDRLRRYLESQICEEAPAPIQPVTNPTPLASLVDLREESAEQDLAQELAELGFLNRIPAQ